MASEDSSDCADINDVIDRFNSLKVGTITRDILYPKNHTQLA